MVQLTQKLDIDGQPLFKGSDKSRSVFRVMTEDEFKASSAEDIQHIFRTQHILVTGENRDKCKFTEEALLQIMREEQLLSINGA